MVSMFMSSARSGRGSLGKDIPSNMDLVMMRPKRLELVYHAAECVDTESKGKIIPIQQIFCLVDLEVLYIAPVKRL